MSENMRSIRGLSWPGALVSRTPSTRLERRRDRKSTRLNSSHQIISYAVFCLKKKKDLEGQQDALGTPPGWPRLRALAVARAHVSAGSWRFTERPCVVVRIHAHAMPSPTVAPR